MKEQSLHEDPDWDGFNKYMDTLDNRELSNIEAYDKAILTVSSAGLALSIAMLNVFGKEHALVFILSLEVAWGLFIVSILSTIGSFLIANKAIKDGKDIAIRHHLKRLPDAYSERSIWGDWNTYLTWCSGLFLSLALIFVVFFAIANAQSRTYQELKMNDKNTVKMATLIETGSSMLPTNQTSSNQSTKHIITTSGSSIPFGASAPQARPTPPVSKPNPSSKGNK